MPLTGTIKSTEAALDHSSAFAVAFAQAWLIRAGSKKVRSGGVIRRALALYVRHLEALPEHRNEVRAVGSACRVFVADRVTQEGAYSRLGAIPEGASLPPFIDLLQGPERLDIAALDDRVNEAMKQIAATRWGRMKGIK